ncbi:MAG: hypothetical protein ABGW85_03010 [Sulfurimonas sp.]|jgi:uncharacterized membrane protein
MMIHPATAHFAMVLPVVASILGVVYLLSREEIMSKIAARATLAAALAMIAAWYTGTQAGPEIYNFLSEAGKEELREHKALGTYLAIAMGIIALIQIAGCRMRKFGLELLAIVLLIGAMATTFKQGKDGGEIVYNYGQPFKAFMIQELLNDAIKEADDVDEDEAKVELYEDAIDEVMSVSQEVNAVYGNTKEADEQEDEE